MDLPWGNLKGDQVITLTKKISLPWRFQNTVLYEKFTLKKLFNLLKKFLKMLNNIDYYLNLPYSIIIRQSKDGVFEASVIELDGCLSHGNTKEEALRMIEDAKLCWIKSNLEAGDRIPEPDSYYLSEMIKLYDLHLKKV